MVYDGRVATHRSAMYGIRMPEGHTLKSRVLSLSAAQNNLPIQSPNEMSGQTGENEVADAVAGKRIRGPTGAWGILFTRLDAVPNYRHLLGKLGTCELHVTDIAYELSTFIATELRATDSPFNRFLLGEDPG